VVREKPVTVDDLKSIVGMRATDLLSFGLEFKESFSPEFDPSNDYRVVYEAVFEPTALDKARIEFWVTDSGYVAVGIETYKRIVRRLELRAIRHGFAVGHEPRLVTKDGLRYLFEAVVAGRIFIMVRV
jgi:hypothetical protein